MKKLILISLFIVLLFSYLFFVFAQTENKYTFTSFEEKLSNVDLDLSIFQNPKFIDLKFFTDLPVKIGIKGRDNPFNY